MKTDISNFWMRIGILIAVLACYDLLWWGLISVHIIEMEGGFAHAFLYPLILPGLLLVGSWRLLPTKGLADIGLALGLLAVIWIGNGVATACSIFLALHERCT
jgi:hypothetical protein